MMSEPVFYMLLACVAGVISVVSAFLRTRRLPSVFEVLFTVVLTIGLTFVARLVIF